MIAYDCHAALNQQFELMGSPRESHIYALGGIRCLDTDGNTPNAHVVSKPCSSTTATQNWSYGSGLIINYGAWYGGEYLCLDAGNLADNTRLTLQLCGYNEPGQNWQIK